MPLYEYVCRDCAASFELRLGYEERLAVHPCPECGSQRTLLRISAAAVVGTGARESTSLSGGCCGGACGCGHAGLN